MKTLAPYTRTIRLYSSTGGVELVPEIANEFGLKVTVGVWLDKNEKRNEREIRSAVELVRKNRNVNGVVVGNETIYRGDFKADELIKVMQQVKREIGGAVPVTTGEIHSSYTDHPELASNVDFIAAHVLPYWEGIPAGSAVDQAVIIYNKLRNSFPGKRIVIAEFGWPSAGYNRQGAFPGKVEQADVLRSFIARAGQLGMDYNIIEAYDQPWKTFEGSVGAYWGLFDNSREPKFSWTGPIADSHRWKIAAIAIAVGLLVSIPIVTIAHATLIQVILLAITANAVGAWAAAVFEYWNGHYFVLGTAFALGLGSVLMIPLVVIGLGRIEEIAGILFGRTPSRLLPAVPSPALVPQSFAPKVSIHIPAYREPPEMVKATLDAIARLTYQNFECIIVINNTPDAAMWLPVEEHCRTLGDRFRFINVPKLEGYKAGALRVALTQTALDAELIAILDADYTVSPEWLTDLVPVFADPKVGLVQAPQDHRDGHRSPLHMAMNGEYAGFFDIGMVQRNEQNAIIVHGTMCIVRRIALAAAGNWSSDTICEDTDLGLTVMELGWAAHYTNRRYGFGLLPDTFEAYKKQRDRWAAGGFQIVKKHWRRFLPGATLLDGDQKREFAFGWLNWLAAESIGVLVAIFNIVWVPVVAFAGIAVPDRILTLPIIATFGISVLHFVALYRRRVAIPPAQAAGAMVAAMSMQWTVARAVAMGLVTEHLAFVRTQKGGAAKARRRVAFPAFYEAVIGGLLLIGAVVVFETNYERVREITLFGIVLLVQSIPFVAAVSLAAFENSRFNDFVFWQSLEAKIVAALPRELSVRRTRISQTATAEKSVELVQ